MKLFFVLVSVAACGSAFAQSSRGSAAGPSPKPLPDISILRPEYAPPPAVMPPRSPAAADTPKTQQELKDLIRAQTEAIKGLSAKVDSLEQRLRRIEDKLR
jgi:hypothetical protein